MVSVVADPIPNIPFDRDESDRKFYEVAEFCDAVFITGNLTHYPEDPSIEVGSIDISVDGYLVDSEAGSDPVSVWGMLGQ